MAGAAPARFELRPMTIGDILDTSFRLYRSSIVTFMAIGLIVYVPYAILLVLIGMNAGEPEVIETAFGPIAQLPPGARLLTAIMNLVFFVIVWPLVQGAMTYNIAARFLGESQSAGDSYRRAAGRVGALLGTQILVGLAVLVGLVLLIVPGVIFSLFFCLIAPVVLLEGLSGARAMSRSRELMRGNTGKAFSLYFVVGVLSWVLQFAIGMGLAMLNIDSPIFDEAAVNVVNAVILPLLTAPTILLYYDIRVRKEAFDLERLATTVDAPVAG